MKKTCPQGMRDGFWFKDMGSMGPEQPSFSDKLVAGHRTCETGQSVTRCVGYDKRTVEFQYDRHSLKADPPQASCMPGADQLGRTDYISLEPDFTYYIIGLVQIYQSFWHHQHLAPV